jgi:transposase
MYPTDLTDAQWLVLEPFLLEVPENRSQGGRPRKYTVGRMADAVLYLVKTGCQWRQLPVNFPPWQSVYGQFRAWRASGVWERVVTVSSSTEKSPLLGA